MNTKLIAVLIILALAGYGVFLMFRTPPEISVSPVPAPVPSPSPTPIPNPTPTPTPTKSGVSGKVTLSPTCPVERVPPDPNCAPKAYSTSIDIFKSGSTKIFKTIKSDADGAFSVNLDPGSYVLQAQGGNTLPRCPEVLVEIKSNQYTKAEISCDTGIR